MAKWQEFGNQMNHLVYVLATKKFQANIGTANRYVAEKTSYGEDSIRMMRQGKFLPSDERTLEILLEIGQKEAYVGREWAQNLLTAARCSNTKTLLNRYYPQDPVQSEIVQTNNINPSFFTRIGGAAIGCLLMLVLWTYVIHPLYPAPHELPVFQECLWGLLIGLGCAAGVAAADINLHKLIFQDGKLRWVHYFLLPASGILGALIWKLCTGFFAVPVSTALITSNAWETFCFGLLYGLAFSLSILFFQRSCDYRFVKFHPALVLIIVSGSCALMALSGYILAIMQPSFANQKDIDIFVGLLLRFALIINIGILFPIPIRQKIATTD